jgi:two-component system chemotaxis response regulator CheY
MSGLPVAAVQLFSSTLALGGVQSANGPAFNFYMEMDTQRSARRILAVDDNRSIRELLASILEGAGFDAFTAEDGQQAREQIRRHSIDLAIIDLVMPDEEGIELIRALRKQHPHLKIIAMSGTFGAGILDAAQHLGADATLSKPFTQDTILECVQKMW